MVPSGMTTTGRLQQRYNHRLRDLVQGTGDVTIATNLGVPRSTARGWLGKAPKVVVSLDVTSLKALELQRLCSVTGAPAVPAIVPESVPCLTPAAARVCA